MRAICKRPEPLNLKQYRGAGFTGFNTYDDHPEKPELQNALLREQRGICCYCMSRIPGPYGMKIEHWHSQSEPEFKHEQLDYSNMLGACKGNEGQRLKDTHCDTHKGNKPLSRNLANPAHVIEALIQYLPDGRIKSAEQAVDTELNEVLNLNLGFLKNNRKSTLDAFKEALG